MISFLKAPIDSRENIPTENLFIKKQSTNLLTRNNEIINEKEVHEVWNKKLQKICKIKENINVRVIYPNLMNQQKQKYQDPLNCLSVEEISNIRSKSPNNSFHIQNKPAIRKVSNNIRKTPLRPTFCF